MHTRSLGLTLFSSLAIFVAACSSGGGTTTSSAPSAAASTAESAAPSEPGSAAPSGKALKIGVVTDVGTLEDKSFNQSSNEGAKAAADAVGGTHDVIVTQAISDYGANIQTFVDKGFDVVVTVGFLIGTDTAKAAKLNPNVHFIGVDQGVCVDEKGDPDATFACKGDAATLLPNYQGIVFAEEQPGYLAGIVAASITKSGTIAAIGGTNVPAVVAYNAGYVAGAKSVKPDIKTLYQETDPDPVKGFNDPAKGKAIAATFVGQGADVLFQIAGLTGQGALEAACASPNVHGIGVDVDQALSIPTVAKCLVTSAEKKLKDTVTTVVKSVADGSFKAGTVIYNAASVPPAIGLSPYHDQAALITPDIQAKIDKAFADMASGALKPPRK
ncbi:MAG TPA: BMP family ABC transporter substrate-binding protein [Candidatus Limnocylindrales bacterium]|jgi:basic membrane protein A|nr:BMP family ABC transporter substrate-binding protein [Candidatus Limnocylindrales bacterium]